MHTSLRAALLLGALAECSGDSCAMLNEPWDIFRQKVQKHTKDRLPIICPKCDARDIGPQLICAYTTKEVMLFDKPFSMVLRGTADLDACGSPATLTGKFEIDLPGQVDDTGTFFIKQALESEAPQVQYDQDNNAFFVERSIPAGWMREQKIPVVATEGGQLSTILTLALESPGQGVLKVAIYVDFCMVVKGIEVCGGNLPDVLKAPMGNPPFELMNVTGNFVDYCPPETTFQEEFDWENWPVPGIVGLLIRIYIIATSVLIFLFLVFVFIINCCDARNQGCERLALIFMAVLLWPVFPATLIIGGCALRCFFASRVTGTKGIGTTDV